MKYASDYHHWIKNLNMAFMFITLQHEYEVLLVIEREIEFTAGGRRW